MSAPVLPPTGSFSLLRGGGWGVGGKGRGNWSKLGFLNLGITDILGQMILCWGAVADGRLSCALWDI